MPNGNEADEIVVMSVEKYSIFKTMSIDEVKKASVQDTIH